MPGTRIAIVWLLSTAFFAAAARGSAQSVVSPRPLKEDLRIVDRAGAWGGAVSALAVSSKGVVAAAFSRDLTIRFFSPAGALLGNFGQRGEGPGDFKGFSLLNWNGDTLEVADASVRRVTRITPARRLAGTSLYDLPGRANGGDDSFLGGFMQMVPVALKSGAVPLIRGTPFRKGGPAGPLRQATMHDADALLVPTNNTGGGKVLTWLDDDCSVLVKTSTMVGRDAIPFCQAPIIATNPVTGAVSIATVRAPLKPYSEYQLTTVRPTGDTILKRSVSIASIPLSEDSVVAYAHSRHPVIPTMPGLNGAAEGLIQAARAAGLPKQYAPVLRMLVSDAGSIWVELYDTRSTHLWEIRAPTGDLIDRVTVPANVKLHYIAGNNAWGVAKDADGVEMIVRYRN